MLKRLLLAAALAAGFASPALAQTARTVASCGAQSLRVGDSTNLFVDSTGILCSTAGSGGGGGGATGSVTSAGTSGTSAQAVQGITGGVPVAVAFSAAPGAQEQDVRSTQTLNAATLNAAVTVPINGQGTLGFNITGLAASGATLTFEQSEDGGTTWTVVNEVNAGTGVATSTRTTDGQSRIAAAGRTNLRFRVSTVGTGTITINTVVSVREGLISLASPLPPGTNAIGGVTQSGTWTFGLSGPIPAGTNTIGTVNLGTLNGAATAAGQAAQQGSVAPGTAAATSVLGGGIYNSTAPTLTSGQQAALQFDVNGNLKTTGGGGSGGGNAATTSNATDGQATSTTNQQNVTYNYLFNGTTWDRMRGTGGAANVNVGNFPSSQAVTNAGTFSVQNTAATPAGTNTIGSINNIAGTVSLPTGAATAANQSSEITQLTSISTRAVTFSEGTNSSVAASANLLGASRAAGSPATYSRFNAAVTTTQSGTLFIQGSNDSAFTVPVALASVAVTAGQFANASVPVIFPFNRAYLFNGTTAGTATLNTSYTAN